MFEEYPHRLPLDVVEPFIPENDDYAYTVEDLINHYEGKVIKVMMLINPDNPSGNFISKTDVLKLEEWCSNRGIRLVVDESFVDFSEGSRSNSLLADEVLETHPKMIVMKSISKSFGVPGLRLGALAGADVKLIQSIKKELSIWNINSFAEFYMQIYNKYEMYYGFACENFVAERKRFSKQLSSIPFLRVIPSQANYFLCQVKDGLTSHQLAEKLLNDYNILIKDCDNKTGLKNKNYVRIAIRNSEDNDTLIKALTSCFKEY